MSYNVLIVDDSKVVRSFISKTLNVAHVDLGTIFEAENGLKALEILKDNWIDIIFLDIYMPEMNGIELLDRMIEGDLLQNTPVVIVSSQHSEPLIEQLKAKGITKYLTKPVTPERLTRVVHEVLGESVGGAYDS